MTAPLSLSRVYAAAKRLMPVGLSAWADDASEILRELSVISWVTARVADRVEAIFVECFPDSAVETLDRWERLFQTAVRTADSLDARRARLIATMGRVAGNTIAQLSDLLAPLFGVDSSQVQWIEVVRSQIDSTLTETWNEGADLSFTPTVTFQLGRPWPGNVDELGVRLLVDIDSLAGQSVALTSPSGTTWAFTLDAIAPSFISNRNLFLGEPAAGMWTVSVSDPTESTVLSSVQLMVSNDVDAAQIYKLRAFADPSLAPNADLVSSLRILRKTAVAHVWSLVCQQLAIVCDSSYGRCDRDPVGV